MEQSILKSTKKVLGVDPDDTSFDLDIITHINSAFSVLHDLGIGPIDGFVIEDEDLEWEDFLPGGAGDPNQLVKLSKVKTCVYLRTRLWFDPPTTSFLLDAIKNQLLECEWRLNANREDYAWTDPVPVTLPSENVLDGGDAN